MAGFMIYFWTFSLIPGWYKPQFKREYQSIHYDNVWYYVLARYDVLFFVIKIVQKWEYEIRYT